MGRSKHSRQPYWVHSQPGADVLPPPPVVPCRATVCAEKDEHQEGCPGVDVCKGCARRPALPGLHLCRQHRRELGWQLRNIADAWPDLTDALAKISGVTSSGFVSGTKDQPLPFNPTASDGRAEVTTWTHHLVNKIMVTRGWCPHPQPAGTVPGLLRWLAEREQIDWLAGHDEAETWSSDGSFLLSLVRRHAYPSKRRHFEAAPCPEDDCAGHLTAVIAPADDLLPSTLRCDTDPSHTWPSDRWMALGRKLHAKKAAEAAKTAAEAVSA